MKWEHWAVATYAKLKRERIQRHIDAGDAEFDSAMSNGKKLGNFIRRKTGRPLHKLGVAEALMDTATGEWSSDPVDIEKAVESHFAEWYSEGPPLPDGVVVCPGNRPRIKVCPRGVGRLTSCYSQKE